MERPASITGIELKTVLELMGLTPLYESGPFCVYFDQRQAERVLFQFRNGWDLPVDEIVHNLDKNGLDVEAFWEKLESLYSG